MALNKKFDLSLSDLQGLAAIASRNGTHYAFSGVALDWCVKANAKIDELQEDLERERMRLVAYREALERVAALDPEKDVVHGMNEWWADAQCFGLAQEIARQALGDLP